MNVINNIRSTLTRIGAVLILLSFFGTWSTKDELFSERISFTGYSLIAQALKSGEKGTEVAFWLIVINVLAILSFIFLHGLLRIPLLIISTLTCLVIMSYEAELGAKTGGGILIMFLGNLFILLSLFFWKRKNKQIKEETQEFAA